MPLPDRPRSRAILIGAGTYQDPRLHDLPSVLNNLNGLLAVLTHPRTGAFDPEHCTVIEDPADERQVAVSLADIAAEAEDVLLVYYAGHGVLGMRHHELYLGLMTTNPDRPQYSALPFKWVRDELLDSPARTKVLILDCCFSGRAIDDFMADRESLVMGQLGVSGTYTLTSSPANEPSLAPPDARYTAFTGELLALLRDGVPSGPAELDLQVLFQQLVHRMTEQGWPVPKQCGTDNVHNLALARNRRHSRAANRNASDRLLQTLLTGQPTPEMIERLLDNRIIVLNTTIEEELADQITAQLLLLAAADATSDIHLYINSPGGSVNAAMAIYDTMELIEPDVATWAVGLASGTAQLLLAAGERGKRSALPHARILMKAPTGSSNTAEYREVLARLRGQIEEITAGHTGQQLDTIRIDMDRTRWFTAFEALEYGLVDQVAARLDAPPE